MDNFKRVHLIVILLVGGLTLSARSALATGGLPPGTTLPPSVCKNLGSITNSTSFDFGSLAVSSAGTVVINTNDVRTTTGGVLGVSSFPHAAQFNVQGCAGYSYNIVLPTTVTLSSTTSSMNMVSFVSSPATTGTLDASGNQVLSVGATLNVGSAQAAGTYTGSFIVEVIFQ